MNRVCLIFRSRESTLALLQTDLESVLRFLHFRTEAVVEGLSSVSLTQNV